MYPWEIRLLPSSQSCLYLVIEYTTQRSLARRLAMNARTSKDPDITWMGDAVGKYEGDTFVVDTIGLSDKTWLDQAGHPHSDALHVIEKFRRLSHDKLELNVTIDDPKAYTKTFSASKLYIFSPGPMGETLCAYSENEAVSGKCCGQDANATKQVALF